MELLADPSRSSFSPCLSSGPLHCVTSATPIPAPPTASPLANAYLSSKSQHGACSAEPSFIFLSAGGCSPRSSCSNLQPLATQRVVLRPAAQASSGSLLEIQNPRSHPSPAESEAAFFFFFWPRRAACGILVPQPGIKPAPPAVEAQSLNHWTAREVPSEASF